MRWKSPAMATWWCWHETYQEICGEKHPFDEKIVVKELLADMRAHKN